MPAAISADLTRLRQILLNLLANAVKFTERGEVVLTVTQRAGRRRPRRPHFRRARHRHRPDADGLSRLFQSFSQADSSTTRKYGGTGLGLAISRRLAELMGGRMWAESDGPGHGAVFSFTIEAPLAELPTTRRREFVGAQPELEGKRVLIVDDNATNRRILSLQAGKWGMSRARHRVAARGARLAVGRRGDARPFDLAILDMHMPEMDGLELARRIRARDAEAAAGSLQLARPARGRRRRVAVQRLSRQAAAPVAAVRHAGRPARRRRRGQARGREGGELEARPRAWRRAIRCASCSPRTTS